MAVDWNSVYRDVAAESAALYENQKQQARAAQSAEAAALAGQADYFKSLVGDNLRAEQQQARTLNAVEAQRLAGAGQGMSETATSTLANSSQRMITGARQQYDDAHAAMALRQTQQAAERDARYAGVMAGLEQARAADTREEGRFRREADGAARKYDDDQAYKSQKLDTKNRQWGAEMNLKLTDAAVSGAQWQADFDQDNTQWQQAFDQKNAQQQARLDFAREQFLYQRQKAAQAKAAGSATTKKKKASTGGGNASAGKKKEFYYDENLHMMAYRYV